MKLQTQLTLAFTTLLLIIMSIAAVMVNSLLLNVFIQNERDQLQEKGEMLTPFLFSDSMPQNFSQWLNDEELYLFIYDRNRDQPIVWSSTLSVEVIQYWANRYDLTESEQPLWRAGDTSYVVSILPIYPNLLERELVLITPLDDLQVIQSNLFNRLMIIFLIGIIVIILLTHFLTHRLVTPLTELKYQLKKIEKRKFDDVKRIKASGEIKEVEESVIEMANELQRYMQSQQQFFQNASHELKTPLMTIQGYAEGIRDGIFVEEDSERGLEVMVDEISRLKKIINEMILLAKLDSDENIYQPEPLSVRELIQLTIDRALPMASERGISLEHEVTDDVLLEVDQEKMLQAMMNMVTNGIRHAHSKVSIQVKRVNKQTLILIEDDGEGIDEVLIPQLFQRFIKGKGGETGLGLAISRAIIERSGGSITVERSPLGGARFTVAF
ncbi:signal transduction histidine kinase [Natronobacillus azotifigens]|uniref:histidine kinase n=1 Tax=Natronobacillus azotifigens TaxID=472978 RepID=A0A9J6RAX1_9BACI|nr:HAMP domain-containing sensor histidine kinase [Natronobacillus azotifigens]MCZ0702709.1 HAMP domain-containing sensor histidine kinase [Natronobacillus azotifigens]